MPEVDIQYPGKLHGLHNDLPLLPERMKIEQVKKSVTNLHKRTDLKKVHRVIKFSQNVWLKSYTNMNTKLRKKTKIILKKIFSSSWIMQFLEKIWKIWQNIEISNL